MQSVVDRNVVMRHIPVHVTASGIPEWRKQTQYCAQCCRWCNSPYRLAISAQNSRQVSDVTVLCLARMPQQVVAAPLTGRRLRLLRNREMRWTALHGLDEKLIVTELPVCYRTKCLLPCSQESATDCYSDPTNTLTLFLIQSIPSHLILIRPVPSHPILIQPVTSKYRFSKTTADDM